MEDPTYPKRLELSKIPPPTSLFPLDLYLCEGGSRIGLTLGWCPCFQDGAGHPGINEGQWHGSTPIRPEAFLSTVWIQYFCLFSACSNHAPVHPAHMQPKPPARIWGGLTYGKNLWVSKLCRPWFAQTTVFLLIPPECWAFPGLQLIALGLGKCPEAESWIIVRLAMRVSFLSRDLALVQPVPVMETAVSCILYSYCLSFGGKASSVPVSTPSSLLFITFHKPRLFQ